MNYGGGEGHGAIGFQRTVKTHLWGLQLTKVNIPFTFFPPTALRLVSKNCVMPQEDTLSAALPFWFYVPLQAETVVLAIPRLFYRNLISVLDGINIRGGDCQTIEVYSVISRRPIYGADSCSNQRSLVSLNPKKLII